MNKRHQLGADKSLDFALHRAHHAPPQSGSVSPIPAVDRSEEFMMILQYQATASWLADGPLAAAGVTRWRARRAGRLEVCDGQVWVTRQGDPDDHVLHAGQALVVGAHEDVVLEPWPGGAPARLVWRGDQPRPLAARVLAALAGAVRRSGVSHPRGGAACGTGC